MNKAVPVRKKVQGLCWGEILTRLRGAAQNTRCEPLEPSTVKAGCFQVEMLSLTGLSAISLLCQLLLHKQIKCSWLDFKEGRWAESQSQAHARPHVYLTLIIQHLLHRGWPLTTAFTVTLCAFRIEKSAIHASMLAANILHSTGDRKHESKMHT